MVGINGASESILSERLGIIRRSHSLSQAEFAARLGVKTRTYRNYELAIRDVPLEVVREVCLAFQEVDLRWLVFGLAPDEGPIAGSDQKMVEMVEAAAQAAHEHFSQAGVVPSPEQASVVIAYVFSELYRGDDDKPSERKSRISAYFRSLFPFSSKGADE